MKTGVFRRAKSILSRGNLYRLLALLLVLDMGYLVGIWPQWGLYAEGPMQRSQFIVSYDLQRSQHPEWPPLRWTPVSLERISAQMQRAVIVAEDARFYTHGGIDLQALRDAVEYNLAEKRLAYGASTISQQTAKNLFLSPSRNPLRKWHELLLTLAMERNLGKDRILAYYLNVAEFGRGIYGVEAAARHYWGIPAARLSRTQAIELAATLPAPVRDNPDSRTAAFHQRVAKVGRYL